MQIVGNGGRITLLHPVCIYAFSIDKSKSICYTDKKYINRGANAMINTVGTLGGAVKGHLPRVWAFPKGLYPGATITSARLSPAWVLCYLIHVAYALQPRYLMAAAIFSALKILPYASENAAGGRSRPHIICFPLAIKYISKRRKQWKVLFGRLCPQLSPSSLHW